MEELKARGEVVYSFSHKLIPYEVWKKIDVPMPDIPSNSISTIIIGSFFAFIIFLIPILWIIEF